MTNGKNGFTLIELLIVVAIIAILAAIAIPNFLAAQVRAKVSRSEAELQSLATALEAYEVDNNVYPNEMVPGTISTPLTPVIQRLVPLTTPIAYITSVPLDVFETNVPANLEGSELFDGYNTYIYAYEPQSVAAGFSDSPGTPGYAALWGNYLWLVEGFGPMMSDPVTWYDGVASATGPLYDPSNGTVSPGHIVRQGP